jgi:hypothetical protein
VAIFATLGGAGAAGAQLGDAERILGLGWPVYLAVLVLVPVAVVAASRTSSIADALESRDRVLVAAASSAAVSWLLAYFVTGEPRLLHDMGVIAFFGIAASVPLVRSVVRDDRIRMGLVAAAITAVAIVTAAGLSAFPAQVAFYHVLTQDRFAAIEWLAANAPEESRAILVSDLSGVSVGWWTEGMVGEEVLFSANLRWLRFETERDRAKLANELLYQSGFPSEASAATFRDAGVQYVFLVSAGAFGVDPADPPVGWQVVFASGDAVVLTPAA